MFCPGHLRVVQALLKKGAILHRDHDGRTPLHLSAQNGHRDTMKLILNVHSHLLDQTDKDGVSSLYLHTYDLKLHLHKNEYMRSPTLRCATCSVEQTLPHLVKPCMLIAHLVSSKKTQSWIFCDKDAFHIIS